MKTGRVRRVVWIGVVGGLFPGRWCAGQTLSAIEALGGKDLAQEVQAAVASVAAARSEGGRGCRNASSSYPVPRAVAKNGQRITYFVETTCGSETINVVGVGIVVGEISLSIRSTEDAGALDPTGLQRGFEVAGRRGRPNAGQVEWLLGPVVTDINRYLDGKITIDRLRKVLIPLIMRAGPAREG